MNKSQPTTSEKRVWLFQGLALAVLAILMIMAFGIPYPAHAETYTTYKVSGFGDTTVNGDYMLAGTHNDYPYFKGGTNGYLYWGTGSQWNIDYSSMPDSNVKYYEDSGQSINGTWKYWLGTSPAGTVTVSSTTTATTTCATSTMATTTIYITGGANLQETLVISCIVIFFLALLALPQFYRMFRRQDPI